MSASSETWQLGSQTVQVSHLKKLYWPTAGSTKGDLLHYYRQIAHEGLPHFKAHPVTLRMFPQGVDGVSYYMRDYPDYAPDWLQRVQYRPKTVRHLVPLPLIDTAAGLIWFANGGPSNSTSGVHTSQISHSPTRPFLIWILAQRRLSMTFGR